MAFWKRAVPQDPSRGLSRLPDELYEQIKIHLLSRELLDHNVCKSILLFESAQCSPQVELHVFSCNPLVYHDVRQ